MKKINKENYFLISWLMCVFLLVGVCNLGLFRETWSGFGDVTGQLTVPYTMSYYSNYPGNVEEEQKTENVRGNAYKVMENIFEINGYEFVSWNSSRDGTGDVYNPNDVIELKDNLTFYAQWKEKEIVSISYGDVNLNGVIDEEDYSLIEESINGADVLEGQALLNADCNIDGKVDLVDADIIKQAFLGTEGYIDSLPDKPILKYEIYVSDGNANEDGENVDKPSDGDETNDDNNSSGNNNGGSSGTGSGNGTSGSGNSSSGGGSNNKPSSGGGSSNNKKPGTGNKPNNNDETQDDSSETDGDDKDVVDENNDKENNNNLPNEEDNEENVSVPNVEKENNGKERKSYVVFIVIAICLLSLRLIIYVINRFKKKNNNSKE